MTDSADNSVLSGEWGDAATYARVEQAIGYLRRYRGNQPALRELARHIGLSESHTQRLFSRWAGISPKRFLQFLTVEYAKRQMAQTADLLGLSLTAGLSGPGRLHDLFVNMEAMSPGEFRRAGRGLAIRYGFGATPFGEALVATTSRGICHLAFTMPSQRAQALSDLHAAWPHAELRADDASATALLARIFARRRDAACDGLSLWVGGTNFQIQVWRAMLRIPQGGLLSYRQLATLLGRPKAARSVGSAIARNPVAYLIPCHRVLRDSGEFGIYHWGAERKIAICAWDAGAAGEDPEANAPVPPGDAETRA